MSRIKADQDRPASDGGGAGPGTHPAVQLDDTVHQRVRLGVLSILSEVDHAEFTYLRQVLEVSDGNLNRHLSVLAEAGYVQSRRVTGGRRLRTWVSMTPAGRQALRKELAGLQRIVSGHEHHVGESGP